MAAFLSTSLPPDAAGCHVIEPKKATAADTASHCRALEQDLDSHPLISMDTLQGHLHASHQHISLLTAIMQRELAALNSRSPQLRLAFALLQQLQQPMQHALSSQRADKRPARQQTVEVVPLLGYCLLQLVKQLQEQCDGHKDPQVTSWAGLETSCCLDDSNVNGTVAGCDPETVLAVMSQCSPFLNGLRSELLSLRKLADHCFQHIKQQLAAMGNLLPPADADDSISHRDQGKADCQAPQITTALNGPTLSRPSRSSTASTTDYDAIPHDGDVPGDEGSPAYYSQGLDLQHLQQEADAAALAVIHLQDCISNSSTALAQLVQQYDIMITAALAAALEQGCGPGQQISTGTRSSSALVSQHKQQQRTLLLQQQYRQASSPQRDGGLRGRVLGPFLDVIRPKGTEHREHKRSAEFSWQYAFMTPGVCSHSSDMQLHSYTAGVPIDVYHVSMNKLLSDSSSTEQVLWTLSVIYARLRFASAAAAAAALGPASGAKQVPAESEVGTPDQAVAAPSSGQTGQPAKQWQAPDKFTRSTTKYWVHPSHILRLKLALSKQLPLLVYGATDPVSSGDIAAMATAATAATTEGGSDAGADAGGVKVASLVSSVYFDGPDLKVYHTRLEREDGARLVRMRWYGPRQCGQAGAQQTVWVEQKTHRDKALGETSFKARACLQQGHLPAYLSGRLDLPLTVTSPDKVELLQQVQTFLEEHQQAPVLRSEYLRTAWQAYDDNAVRFSLDEHMLLLREAPPSSSSSPGAWCQALEVLQQLPAADAVRFPYGILEIKLKDKEAAPDWVHELKTSGVLVEVPKFSKFLHGMALLLPDKIRSAPSWFVWRDDEGVALPASLDEMWDMTADRRLRQAMDWQDRLEQSRATSTAAPSSAVADVSSTLMLLRAPRLCVGSHMAGLDSVEPMQLIMPAASKQGLSTSPSYELTATAAPAAAAAVVDHLMSDCFHHPHDAAACSTGVAGIAHQAADTQPPAAGTPVLPVSTAAAAAVDSHSRETSHLARVSVADAISVGSSRLSQEAPRALCGPAHDIMADGQFGCAGLNQLMQGGAHHRSSASEQYRGTVGGMQPQLGVMLPGRRDSLLCIRHCEGWGEGGSGPALRNAAEANVSGSSPTFGPSPLTVRVPPDHALSCSSSSSVITSDPDLCHSSSSLDAGPADPTAAVVPGSRQHITAWSSSTPSTCPYNGSPERLLGHQPPCSHLPQGVVAYPKVNLSHEVVHAGAHEAAQPRLQGHASAGRPARPHSRNSSSGGTSDSWRLPAVTPSFTSPLVPPAASTLGPISSGNQLTVSGKLEEQHAAPFATTGQKAATAAAARPQIVQLHYTGAVFTAAVEQLPRGAHVPAGPDPHTTSCTDPEAHLLPQGANSTARGVVVGHHQQQQQQPTSSRSPEDLAAALDAAEAGRGAQDQCCFDGVMRAHLSTPGGSGKDVQQQGNCATMSYRQRVQRWRAALGRRFRGGVGGKGKGTGSSAAAVNGQRGLNNGGNEHMLGFAGNGPRQPSYVKPRADPKTFFANERTFLQWLQISVLVMMTGLGMLTGSTIAASSTGGACTGNMICSATRISGAIIAPVSILFMMYALYLYHQRTRQLLARSTLRYDDARGPWLLTTLLILVTIVVIVLGLEAYKFAEADAKGHSSTSP